MKTKNFKKLLDGPSTWSRLKIHVYQNDESGNKKLLGTLERNYSSLYGTWCPFVQDGKEYALCSLDYTGVTVISLPDLKIVAQEPRSPHGFCPVGLYVPDIVDGDEDAEDENFAIQELGEDWDEYGYYNNFTWNPKFVGKFGYVCGCTWGDDHSWKVQFLDLSEISSGKIIREDRFGYQPIIELDSKKGSNMLRKAIKTIFIDAKGIIHTTFFGMIETQTTLKSNDLVCSIDGCNKKLLTGQQRDWLQSRCIDHFDFKK